MWKYCFLALWHWTLPTWRELRGDFMMYWYSNLHRCAPYGSSGRTHTLKETRS